MFLIEEIFTEIEGKLMLPDDNFQNRKQSSEKPSIWSAQGSAYLLRIYLFMFVY